MTLFDSRNAARMTALAGATLLIAASAALSTLYAWQVGSHAGLPVAVALAAAALGGELLKPFAVAAVADCARTSRWWHALAAALLAGAAVAFSFTSELGLAATARSDRAAERTAARETGQALREGRDRAVAELNALPVARSAAEIQPQIALLVATPGANGCVAHPDGPISRSVCGEVNRLQAEAARAQRRAELEEAIALADSRLAGDAGASPHVASDPLAATLAAYAVASGRPLAPDDFAPWLALPLVVLLEIGSAFGVMVARATGTIGPPVCQADADAGIAPDRRGAGGEQRDEPPPVTEQRTPEPPATPVAPSDAVAAAVLGLIASRGGKVAAAQRELASAVGFPLSRVNGTLHRMAAAGQISLDIGKTGTVIALPN